MRGIQAPHQAAKINAGFGIQLDFVRAVKDGFFFMK
jgi:hypothetical protein